MLIYILKEAFYDDSFARDEITIHDSQNKEKHTYGVDAKTIVPLAPGAPTIIYARKIFITCITTQPVRLTRTVSSLWFSRRRARA